MQCGRCVYWDRTPLAASGGVTPQPATESVIGRCRRHAPPLPRHGLRAEWPSTSAVDWCGEFLQRGDDVL